MSQLCKRCELLFQECRPLRGAVCPMLNEEEPHTKGHKAITAAIVVDEQSAEVKAIPFLAVDFYEGRP